MAGNSTRFRAVILAGGSGERFWQLSTSKRPKQFLSIFGGKTLIRQSVERLAGLVKPEDVFIITSKALAPLTRRELPEIPKANIIGEPMRRDTGAAVALGVGVAGTTDDTVLGFFPADQLVSKPAAFRTTLRKAIKLAQVPTKSCQNHCPPTISTYSLNSSPIVTLGITPTYPATGFGYINPENGTFVEKPNAEKAREYLEKGYLWNAGMFIAAAGTFRQAFAAHAPDLSNLSNSSNVSNLAKTYSSLPRISFDYAVMEKHSPIAVVPGDFGWDDVGSYGAFDAHFAHDAAGNVTDGEVKAVESEGSICVAKGVRITVLGVKDLVVVTSGKDVLVVPKSRAGELKKIFA